VSEHGGPESGQASGWQPLSKPPRRRGFGNRSSNNPPAAPPGNLPPEAVSSADGPGKLNSRLNLDGSPVVTSFVRLARTHAFHAAGDATYAVALVGSIFALDTDAARGRILLYLLLTLAPFALVGPFIGPALDRMQGGRRLMIILTLAARAVIMILLVRNIETFWLFPLAFTQLVMGKTYSVAKAATVPTTVNSEDELVDKNARLAVLGTVAGGVGAAPALGLQAIWGSAPTVVYGFLIYSLGVAAATRLPRVVVDDPDVSEDETDLKSAGVRLAASAMSVLRGVTGFVFWLMVFAYGNNDIDTDGIGKAAGLAVRAALGFSIEGDDSQPAWKLGFVLASIGLGIFLGNVLAPRLRERISEEYMIIGAIGTILFSAIAATWAGGLSGAVLLALIVGAAPASAKLAFDSLVQRDAPGANHGAAFGRFETRFQIASVIGSVIAVAPTVVIPVRAGSVIVALAALVAGGLYLVGSRAMRTGQPSPWSRLFERRLGGDPDADGAAGQVVPERDVYRAPPTTEVQAVPVAPSGPPPAAPQAAPAAPSTPPPAAPAAPATPPPPTAGQAPVAPHQAAPGQAEPASADPYAQAFSDRPVEPPDWASAAFDDEPAHDPMLPPQWLDGHSADSSADPYPDGEPTPPFGTPQV
jgi:MFS family permease